MENDNVPLHVYKDGHPITNTQQLPVPHSNRICTDLFCTIMSIISILILLIIAIFCFDLNKLTQSTYPTDIEGRLCTLQNSNYNYLYFTSPQDTTKRLCISQCPKGHEKSLKCLPSQNLSCQANNIHQYQVIIYPSQQQDTSMGLFCFPQDPQLKKLILKNSKLQEKYLFVTAYKSIFYSAACSVGLGILFLIFTILLPRIATYFSIGVGGVSSIAIGIFLMTVNSQILHVYQIIIYIVCGFMILVGLMCLISLIFKLQDLKYCSSFLIHAGKYLSQNLSLVLIIFVYYIIMIGLFALMIFQILGFWSSGQLKFIPQQINKQLGGKFSTIMIIICAIQFFWILSFLKQSFDFIVSGNAVYFYFKKKQLFSFALGNLFKYHWGSVVAGSFLLNFFYIFDTFHDFIKPVTSQNSSAANFCCLCDRILGFARSDTFSFINLVGLPYLNSARMCEEIDDRSVFFQGSQSIFRFFRIGAHIMLASFSTLITFAFMSAPDSQISVLGLILSFIINLFVVTFFVSMIAQIAEALLLSTLVQKYIKNQDQIQKVKTSNKNQKNQLRNTLNGGYTIHQTQE